MKVKTVMVLLSVVLSLSMCSCMNTVNTAENSEKSMNRSFVKNKRIVTDGFLRDRLEILRVDEQTLPDGLKKIQVTFRSTRVGFWSWLWHGDNPYRIAYRFTWFNQAGMVIDTPASVWIEKQVIPGDTVWISTVAPNENCKDFVLKLKEL